MDDRRMREGNHLLWQIYFVFCFPGGSLELGDVIGSAKGRLPLSTHFSPDVAIYIRTPSSCLFFRCYFAKNVVVIHRNLRRCEALFWEPISEGFLFESVFVCGYTVNPSLIRGSFMFVSLFV